MSAAEVTKSTITGLMSYGTSLLLAVALPSFNDARTADIVWAMIVSSSGGFFVALMPLGEKSWSWTVFLKLVVLGGLAGYPTYVVLTHPYLNLIDSVKGAVEFLVGMLAYPIGSAIQKTGPVRLLAGLFKMLDKFRPSIGNDPDPEGK